MAKTTTQIQKDSDSKRGVRVKGIKMPIATIELLEQLSHDTAIPQNKIVCEAIQLWADSQTR